MIDINIFDVFGSIGAITIVITYMLLQLKKIKSDDLLYSILNAIGAGLILLSLIYKFNLSAFLIEIFWLFISIYGIVIKLKNASQPAKEN